MAQRGIREYEGKKILFDGLAKYMPVFKGKSEKLALVRPDTDPKKLVKDHPWLLKEKLVAKPDQLFGKRGKHGLLCLNKDWKGTWEWISERMNKTVTVGKTTGELKDFLIEPFTPHSEDAEECYVAIRAYRDFDTIYLSNKGGIYVEENWDKVKETNVPVLSSIDDVKLNMPEVFRPVISNRSRAVHSLPKGVTRSAPTSGSAPGLGGLFRHLTHLGHETIVCPAALDSASRG